MDAVEEVLRETNKKTHKNKKNNNKREAPDKTSWLKVRGVP